jgi:phosphatidylserine/phosphatidylglycerophosphate/cardiolipin synthase-like enzyme
MPRRSTSPPPAFDWDALDQYKAEKRFLDGYPPDFRTFWSPRDDIHGMLLALLGSAQHSLVLNMYGYADDELDATIRAKLADDSFYVQMSLDKSQAGGVHERELLKKWKSAAFGNSIAIGSSSRHAISHLKIVIVDGVYTVRGSTNWSLSGEQKQDNELTLSRSAVIAADTRAVLDRNHDWMLKQMAEAEAGKKDPVSAARTKARAAARGQRARRPAARTRAK